MRVWTLSAIAAACATGALFAADTSAQAQSARKKEPYYFNARPPGVVATRYRSRIIVHRRSYLDPGNEVMPGERNYQEYAIPYGYSAIGNALGPSFGWDRRPLNDPWDTPAPRGF